MNQAVVPVNGSGWPSASVLGRGPVRIPTGGRIRAGIKVLTKKASEEPRALAIYERGVEAGDSYERIESAIVAALPALKAPLVPKNVAWFTVRPGDFGNPALARQILEAYGEDRGDGEVRLYRFPVVFPADAWQAVMPHELVAWSASGKRYWSEYSADGQTRYCKRYQPVPMDASGAKAIRVFGGRKSGLREERSGLCDPEGCAEYQSRQCNLSGRFIFFIPGIASITAFELATHSFYSMNAAIQRFQTIAFMRGGRISGFLDDKRTPFTMSKQLVEVPHIDEMGRPVRVKQWLIDLQAPIDVTALLRGEDEVFDEASAAARMLEGPSGGDRVAADEPPGDFVDDSRAPPDARHRDAQASATASEAMSPCADAPGSQDVLDAATRAGMPAERFEAYAALRWGTGWKHNTNGRRRALQEIQRCGAALLEADNPPRA
jgi:hypothetical protein